MSSLQLRIYLERAGIISEDKKLDKKIEDFLEYLRQHDDEDYNEEHPDDVEDDEDYEDDEDDKNHLKEARVPKEPKPPKAPKAPKIPKIPKPPKEPKPPKAPKTKAKEFQLSQEDIEKGPLKKQSKMLFNKLNELTNDYNDKNTKIGQTLLNSKEISIIANENKTGDAFLKKFKQQYDKFIEIGDSYLTEAEKKEVKKIEMKPMKTPKKNMKSMKAKIIEPVMEPVMEPVIEPINEVLKNANLRNLIFNSKKDILTKEHNDDKGIIAYTKYFRSIQGETSYDFYKNTLKEPDFKEKFYKLIKNNFTNPSKKKLHKKIMNGSIEDIVALMKKYLSGDADYTDDKDIIKFGREFGRRSGNML